jgi:hypothetical protein
MMILMIFDIVNKIETPYFCDTTINFLSLMDTHDNFGAYSCLPKYV